MTSTKTRNRIVLCPYRVALSRAGRKSAQSPIDERHLLRVLFEEERDRLVIITVYVAAREPAVSYDQNRLPMCLEIEKAREFVLGTMRNVLLHKEVSIA